MEHGGSLNIYNIPCLTIDCILFSSAKKELEEELHVVTNNLRSLEIGEEKVSCICICLVRM